MPRLLVVLALFCVSILTAVAQPPGYPVPYGGTSTTYLGQFTASTDINGANGKKVSIIFGVVVWTNANDDIEYSLSVADMSYSGEVEVLGSLTAIQVFDAVSAAAARGGTALGYSPAVACPSSGKTGVTLASCVTRDAGGFTANGSSTVRRAYSYCGNGVTATTVTGGASCGSGAEATTVMPLGLE